MKKVESLMHDTEFISAILGLKPPWIILKVELKTESKRLDLDIAYETGKIFPCPICGRPSVIRDHEKKRDFQYSRIGRMAAFIHAKIPQINCRKHGILYPVLELGEEQGNETSNCDLFLTEIENDFDNDTFYSWLD